MFSSRATDSNPVDDFFSRPSRVKPLPSALSAKMAVHGNMNCIGSGDDLSPLHFGFGLVFWAKGDESLRDSVFHYESWLAKDVKKIMVIDVCPTTSEFSRTRFPPRSYSNMKPAIILEDYTIAKVGPRST